MWEGAGRLRLALVNKEGEKVRPKYQNTKIPKYQNTKIIKYQNTKIPYNKIPMYQIPEISGGLHWTVVEVRLALTRYYITMITGYKQL